MNYKEAQDKWIEHYDRWNEAYELLREVKAQISVIMKAQESRVKSGVLQDLRAKSKEFEGQVDFHQNEMEKIIQSLD